MAYGWSCDVCGTPLTLYETPVNVPVRNRPFLLAPSARFSSRVSFAPLPHPPPNRKRDKEKKDRMNGMSASTAKKKNPSNSVIIALAVLASRPLLLISLFSSFWFNYLKKNVTACFKSKTLEHRRDRAPDAAAETIPLQPKKCSVVLWLNAATPSVCLTDEVGPWGDGVKV